MSPPSRALQAERAQRAHAAMQRFFGLSDGGYRHDDRWGFARRRAHLWPVARALAAGVDTCGISGSCAGAGAEAPEPPAALELLERYWDAHGPHAAYASSAQGWFGRRRGSRFYDDNAWVGLVLVELERLRPGTGALLRARELYAFGQSGWDPPRGGIFWVEQGRGRGRRNHDRNLVSTAPMAQLGLHLRELDPTFRSDPSEAGTVGPEKMYEWLLETLDSSRDGLRDGDGPFWDKVRGDGSIDRATWSYNQGSMVAVKVLLARREPTRAGVLLAGAGALARHALGELMSSGFAAQPAAFNAILFRDLFMLHHATAEEELREEIMQGASAYASWLWETRDARGLVRPRGRPSLLDQSAAVQVLALLAWEPESYHLLA